MTRGRPAGGVRCCGSLDVLLCRSKGIPGGSYSTPDWFTHSAPWGPRHPRVTARAIHRPSGGESLDIACGVGVGVRLVPAHRTGEQPSAPRPGHRVPVAARRARLRGGLRRHKQQLRPEQWRLIDQLATPLARGIVQDGPPWPSRFPQAADGAPDTGSHALHPQVLDSDPAVAFGEVGGEPVGEVGSTARLSRSEPGDLRDGAAHPARISPPVVSSCPAEPPGQAALQTTQASSFPLGQSRGHQARC